MKMTEEEKSLEEITDSGELRTFLVGRAQSSEELAMQAAEDFSEFDQGRVYVESAKHKLSRGDTERAIDLITRIKSPVHRTELSIDIAYYMHKVEPGRAIELIDSAFEYVMSRKKDSWEEGTALKYILNAYLELNETERAEKTIGSLLEKARKLKIRNFDSDDLFERVALYYWSKEDNVKTFEIAKEIISNYRKAVILTLLIQRKLEENDVKGAIDIADEMNIECVSETYIYIVKKNPEKEEEIMSLLRQKIDQAENNGNKVQANINLHNYLEEKRPAEAQEALEKAHETAEVCEGTDKAEAYYHLKPFILKQEDGAEKLLEIVKGLEGCVYTNSIYQSATSAYLQKHGLEETLEMARGIEYEDGQEEAYDVIIKNVLHVEKDAAKARRVAKEIKDKFDQSFKLRDIAQQQIKEEDIPGASDTADETPNKYKQSETYFDIADYHIDKGEYHEAAKALELALQSAHQITIPNITYKAKQYLNVVKYCHRIIDKLKEEKKPIPADIEARLRTLMEGAGEGKDG